MLRRLKAIGPAAIVAAAFIGPGTITVAAKAGGNYGYQLLWAVAFSTLACLVLQEMAARLGVVGQVGAGEAISRKFKSPAPRIAVIGLVLSAILVGNAAFESGNISGGVLGFKLAAQDELPPWLARTVVLFIATTAFALLWTSKYKLVERTLIGLVAAMGMVFLTTAVLVQPNWPSVLGSLTPPKFSANGIIDVLALIGTTVVPYNLFLHAAAANARWDSKESLNDARLDTALSILGGGIITAAILVTAASAFDAMEVAGAEASGKQLADIFAATTSKVGVWFRWFMAVGFFAAGLSSAITAPLAAAFATAELFGWPKQMSDFRFRVVWMSVLIVGVVFALMAQSPQQLIVFAQAANGLLLPVVAFFLIWIANDKKLLGEYRNGWFGNALAAIVMLLTTGLGITWILKAFKVIG